MPPASLRRWGPWTVGRLWTQASHNSGRLIKVLIDRNGPCCKKPTQRLQLCYVTDLGTEMPASPCPIPHRGSSVSAERNTTRAHTRASSSWLLVVTWVCLEGVLLEWENSLGGCCVSGCWGAEHSRGMLLITHVHPFICSLCYWLCFGYTWMETHPVLPTCVFSSCRRSWHYSVCWLRHGEMTDGLYNLL